MQLFDILKDIQNIENKYSLIGEGSYSKVFLINENVVLKISNHQSDGFRHVAELNKKQLEEINFVNIHESYSDQKTGIMYFLMERLFPLSLDEQQQKSIKRINIKLWNKQYFFNFSEYNSLEKEIIKNALNLKISLPPQLDYDWDLNHSNIMIDKNGCIKMSDPISECAQLSKDYIQTETEKNINERILLQNFLTEQKKILSNKINAI